VLASTSAIVCLVRDADFGPETSWCKHGSERFWYGEFHCVAALLDVMTGFVVNGIELREAATGITTRERAMGMREVGRSIISELRVVVGGLQLQLQGLNREFACESSADLTKPPEPLKQFL
jgi:hypothetical protein